MVRYAMFVLGLFIGAFGCVLMIKANLGVSPWDVFHIGLQKTFGLTIGLWSQIVGVIVIFLSFVLAKIKPTFGMFLNMICFGLFLDMFLWMNIIPEVEGIVQRVLMLLTGLLVSAVGIGMYLSPRLGAGPRDSFMLAMNERMGWSIQRVRLIIEVSVLLAGAALGECGIGRDRSRGCTDGTADSTDDSVLAAGDAKAIWYGRAAAPQGKLDQERIRTTVKR